MNNKIVRSGKLIVLIVSLLMFVVLISTTPLTSIFPLTAFEFDVMMIYVALITMLPCIVAPIVYGLCNMYGVSKWFGFLVYSCSLLISVVVGGLEMCYMVVKASPSCQNIVYQLFVTVGSIVIGIGFYLSTILVCSIIQKISAKKKIGVMIVLIINILMVVVLITVFPLTVYHDPIFGLISIAIYIMLNIMLPCIVALINLGLCNMSGINKWFGFATCVVAVLLSDVIGTSELYKAFPSGVSWAPTLDMQFVLIICPVLICVAVYLLTMLCHSIIKKSLEKKVI